MDFQNERTELKQAMAETKDLRLFRRYQAVYLWLQGHKRTDIAAIVGLTRKTVDNYVNAYQENGLDGLMPGRSSGRPHRLTPEQEAELKAVVTDKMPSEMGFENRATWTLKLMVAYVKERWGISYTRPTYTMKKADPEKQRAFREETFPRLKKLVNDDIAHLLFLDESMIRDYQAIQRAWFPKGEQRTIPTYGKHGRVKLMGCLDYDTGEILCQEREKYDAIAFQAFLETIVAYYDKGKIIIILDNARIHHAKVIQPFLSTHQDRLSLVFLPPYSPELNLIEGFWKWLKEACINNVFFRMPKKSLWRFGDSSSGSMNEEQKSSTGSASGFKVNN